MAVPLLLGTLAISVAIAGAAVSTVHVNVAGVGSTLFAASTALTWNVWLPSYRPVISLGEEHATAVNAPPSSLPSNGVVGWSPMLSVPENINLIELNYVLAPLLMELPPVPLGTVAELIVVSGAVVSTIVAFSQAISVSPSAGV